MSVFPGTEIPRRRQVLRPAYLMIFVLFIGVSGLLDDGRGRNPIGFPNINELFMALLLLLALLYALSHLSGRGAVKRIDFFVFLIVFGGWFASAFNSNIMYNQPLLYGLIEDRKILYLLFYFPVVYALRSRWIDEADLVSLIRAVAVISILLSIILVSMGLGHDSKAAQRGILEAREDRLGIGTPFIILNTLLAFIYVVNERKQRGWWLLWMVAGLGTMVFINQTRHIILTVLGVMFLYVLKAMKRRSTLKIIIASFVIAMLIMLLFGDSLLSTRSALKLTAMWGELVNEDFVTQSVRARDIDTIFKNLEETPLWWGHGALSLLWKDGFHRMYGKYFFIVDTGIFGFFFRYGLLLALIFIGLCIYTAIYAYKAMNPGTMKRFVGLGLFYVFLVPSSGIFLYSGIQLGMLLALASGSTVHEQGNGVVNEDA